MRDNPIMEIENAELEAKQLVLKAGNDKLSLIREAKENAGKSYLEAIQKAREDGERVIREAEAENAMNGAVKKSGFENKKSDIINKAKNNEDAAIHKIIEIISGKSS